MNKKNWYNRLILEFYTDEQLAAMIKRDAQLTTAVDQYKRELIRRITLRHLKS